MKQSSLCFDVLETAWHSLYGTRFTANVGTQYLNGMLPSLYWCGLSILDMVIFLRLRISL